MVRNKGINVSMLNAQKTQNPPCVFVFVPVCVLDTGISILVRMFFLFVCLFGNVLYFVVRSWD